MDYASVAGPDTEVRPGSDAIEWRYDIPLLTSGFMLWDFFRVILISVGAMYLLVALTGLVLEGELIILPPMVFFLTSGIMLGLFVLTSLLLGNRQGARFVIGPRGVEYHAEKRERRMNKLAVVIGLLALNPTTAGAGALAMTREKTLIPWGSIHSIRVYPRSRVIALKNSWRTVMRLHCPPELFEVVVSAVKEHHDATRPTD